ncbi:hypothetical protein ACH9ZK_14260 [Lacticaseibacillus paracasei]|uniref:hypothetical protein n=1 Tax=Lacticaseibacillus paracasei TaxID=1597 RepID=UPI0037DFC00A
MDNVAVQLTDLNPDILSQSDQYDGFNQDSNMLSFLISADLVKISDELVEKVTDQLEIQTLVISFVNTDNSQWDEIQEQLFDKLDVTSLMRIAAGEISGMSSYQRLAVVSLIQNYIGESDFTDKRRNILLDSLLEIGESPVSKHGQQLADVLDSYRSESIKLDKLTQLINDGLIVNDDIKVSLQTIKDPELAKIANQKDKTTIHLVNSSQRWNFVNTLYKKGVIKKAMILQNGGISIKI